jgi:hypothetical protein
MKTQNIVFALLIFISAKTNAQWLADYRLTYDPANSATSPNNAWCVAASGSFVHAIWYDERDFNKEIYYKRSTDDGVTWGADTRLTNNSFSSSAPAVSASGQVVHIAWVDDRDGNDEIYYKRSTDDGVTWGPDTRLTDSTGTSENPCVSASGQNVHIVWQDNRDGNFEIYYKQSTDGGVSWGADTRLTNNSSYSSPPSIAVSGSILHVVWADNRDANIEIYYKRSTDSGISWGADTRLTNDPSYSGDASVAASGSNVYVVWSDQRDGFLVNEIYCKSSTDGGITWGIDTRLTYALWVATYPSISVSGSNVHVVWNDSRDWGGGGFFEIYCKRSTDGGLSWGGDTQLTNDSNESEFSSVTISGSVVHVVWADYRDGNPEIYYKRDPAGNPLGTNEFAHNSIHIYPNPATNQLSIINYQSSIKEIEIYNALGENIFKSQISPDDSGLKSQISIDVSQLLSGIYFVKIRSDKNNLITRKLVKI